MTRRTPAKRRGLGVRSGAVWRPAPELHRGDTVVLTYPPSTPLDLMEGEAEALSSRGIYTMSTCAGAQVLAVVRGPSYVEVGGA